MAAKLGGRPAPQRLAIGAPREVHLHFHGISAEEVAAIMAGQGIPAADEK